MPMVVFVNGRAPLLNRTRNELRTSYAQSYLDNDLHPGLFRSPSPFSNIQEQTQPLAASSLLCTCLPERLILDF